MPRQAGCDDMSCVPDPAKRSFEEILAMKSFYIGSCDCKADLHAATTLPMRVCI